MATHAVEHLMEQARARRRQLPPPDVRRALRVRAGLSQREIGAALGVSNVAVCRWETGQRTPRGRHLLDYAHLLDRLAVDVTHG